MPGAASFPLLKAVPFFGGRVNKLVAEVGRGAAPDGARPPGSGSTPPPLPGGQISRALSM